MAGWNILYALINFALLAVILVLFVTGYVDKFGG